MHRLIRVWLRRTARNALAAAMAAPVLGDRLWRRTLAGHAFVFMFHRVLPAAEYAAYYDPERVVTAETFAALLSFLRRDFDVVALEDLSPPARGGRPRCALTFDDGWEDNARCAWPLLRREHAPATIFLVTGYLDRDRLLWPDTYHRLTAGLSSGEHRALFGVLRQRHAWLSAVPAPARLAQVRAYLARLPVPERAARGEALTADLFALQPQAAAALPRRAFLHADEVARLRQAGCSFGAHTVSHLPLTSLDAERLGREMVDCPRTLEARLGLDVHSLSYPYGSFDARVVRAAAAAGYDIAVTSDPHALWPEGDRLQWPRVGLCEAMMSLQPGRFRPALLRAHLMALLLRTRRQPPPRPASPEAGAPRAATP